MKMGRLRYALKSMLWESRLSNEKGKVMDEGLGGLFLGASLLVIAFFGEPDLIDALIVFLLK